VHTVHLCVSKGLFLWMRRCVFCEVGPEYFYVAKISFTLPSNVQLRSQKTFPYKLKLLSWRRYLLALWNYNPNYSLPQLPKPAECTTCTHSYCNVSFCVHLLPPGFFALRIPNKFCSHFRFLTSTTILQNIYESHTACENPVLENLRWERWEKYGVLSPTITLTRSVLSALWQ
jgi:hypothetical protein